MADIVLRERGLLQAPDTLEALLPSDGYVDKRPTLHRYTDTRRATGGNGADGVAFIFTCDETGAERVWGFEGES